MTCDETTRIDNTSWIAIHLYVMQNWVQVPLLIHLQKLESNRTTSHSLTSTLTTTLATHGRLQPIEISTKLVCFDADGTTFLFEGKQKGVTKLLHRNLAPFTIEVHYFWP